MDLRNGAAMGIRKRFFLLISIFFAIIIVVVGIVIINLSSRLLLNEYTKLAEDNLNYVVEITNRELKQLSGTIEFIAKSPTVVSRVNTDYTSDVFAQKIADDRVVDALVFSVTTGKLYNYLNALYIKGASDHYLYKISNDFINQDSIQKLMSQQNIWSPNQLTYLGIGDTLRTDRGELHTIKFTRALVNDEYAIAGKLHFELSVNYLQEILSSHRRNKDIRLTLVDADGLVLFDRNPDLIGKPYISDEELEITMERPVHQFGWSIIGQTDHLIRYDEHHEVLRTMLLMFIILLVILTVWIKVVLDRLIEPIAQISIGMRRVRNGDYSIRLVKTSNDELGQLVDNFNAMAMKYEENVANEVETAKTLKDLEYKTLQAQINPHFMYNALHAIKYIASIQKLNNISSLVSDLWVLLKNASRIEGQFVTLAKEIEVIQAYVRIQEVRYKGKFEVIYTIDDEINQMVLPKYSLQPFVENAIFHGIAPKKGLGLIEIIAYMENNELVLIVQDDGVGMTGNPLEQSKGTDRQDVKQKHNGLNSIGVMNVDERMKLLFGQQYGVVLESREGIGTKVTLRFPNKF